MKKQLATEIVNKIINDLNGRSGFDLNSLDNDIQEEIKTTWTNIVMNTKIKTKTKINIRNLDNNIEFGINHCGLKPGFDNIQYIKDYIKRDYDDVIEDLYGDDLPDGGFSLKLYFSIDTDYYMVDIYCKTRWESSWSSRRNFIDNIDIKNVEKILLDLNVYDIDYI